MIRKRKKTNQWKTGIRRIHPREREKAIDGSKVIDWMSLSENTWLRDAKSTYSANWSTIYTTRAYFIFFVRPPPRIFHCLLWIHNERVCSEKWNAISCPGYQIISNSSTSPKVKWRKKAVMIIPTWRLRFFQTFLCFFILFFLPKCVHPESSNTKE